jgi:CBS domain-containing membrane protein
LIWPIVYRQALIQWFQSFAPPPVNIPWRERLRACVGALIGIAITGLSMHWLLGPDAQVPFLIAPMGASAVLLFAAPASPLAQPWSFVGGNLVAATFGVASAHWIADPVAAAAFALACATCAMLALRCVHPPSGAVALTAVLGGPAVHALGFRFVAEPVALQSLILLAAAIIYHAITGHRYPHASRAAAATPEQSSGALTGVTRADLEAVMRQHGEWIDVAADDLESVVREAQLRAYARGFTELSCAQIMARDVVSVTGDTSAASAWRLLGRHRIKALPVVDDAQHVIGIITRTDVAGCIASGLRRRGALRLLRSHAPASVQRVDTLMTQAVRTVDASVSVADLIPLFAHSGHHHIPVVDKNRRLVGMVTQSDLIGGLHRQTQERELRSA